MPRKPDKQLVAVAEVRLADWRDRLSLGAGDAGSVVLQEIASVQASVSLTRACERPFQPVARWPEPTLALSRKAQPQTIPSGGTCRRVARRTTPAAAASD